MSPLLEVIRSLRHPDRALLVYKTRAALHVAAQALIDEQRELDAAAFLARITRPAVSGPSGTHADYRAARRIFVNKAKGVTELRINTHALERQLRGRSFVFTNLPRHEWPKSLHAQISEHRYPFGIPV